jgi:CheY-like chemotaxis protein
MTTEKEIPTILVVDDEAEIREILAIHIERCGFQVVEAEDGQRALEVIRSQHIDVVMSDIMMPRMSGMTFLRALRDEGFDCPFVFITAYPSKEATVDALRLGAFDFIEKPFESEDIARLVREAARVATERRRISAKPASDESGNSDSKKKPTAEQKIMSLRTLRYQKPEGGAKPGVSPAESARVLEMFTSEAIPQLVFSEVSVKGLSDDETRTWELGYLFRVMQGIRIAAESVDLKDISAFAGILEGCFTHYRVRPGTLTPGEIEILSQGIPALREMISIVGIETPFSVVSADAKANVEKLWQGINSNEGKSAS